MAVPRSRRSNARKRANRSHFGISSIPLDKCVKCSDFKQPHRVCENKNCNFYR